MPLNTLAGFNVLNEMIIASDHNWSSGGVILQITEIDSTLLKYSLATRLSNACLTHT